MEPLNKPDSLAYALKGMWIMLRGNPETINFSLCLVIIMLSAHTRHLKKTEKYLLTITILIVMTTEWINNALGQLRHRLT